MPAADHEQWSRTSVMVAEHNRDHPGRDDVDAARDAVDRTRAVYGKRPPPPGRATVALEWTREFVRRHGWRAYAVPVLAVLTILALATSGGGSGGGSGKAPAKRPAAARPPASTAPPQAGNEIKLKGDTAGKNVDARQLKAAALPAGPAYTMKGAGTFRVLKGTSPVVGSGSPVHRYDIEVENGVKGVDLTQFAADVVKTLSDKRSWSGHGVALQRVDSGSVDWHITLTSALTVRKFCGYTIKVETSCYAPKGSQPAVTTDRVVFNVARWMRGSAAYIGDLAAYRTYMINHEDGHALGHEHAHECLPGGLAPAMMQQSFGLRSAATNKLCEANPWPYPAGAEGAPGAEQADTPKNDEYGLGD